MTEEASEFHKLDINEKPVLVIGFSVVAENSLVEIAHKKSISTSGRSIKKIGLGGWFPFILKYLIDNILDQHPAAEVVFEISTSSLRGMNRPHEDHKDSLLAFLHACRRRNLPVSFLDLPRTDIDNEDDWMFQMHADFCKQHDLGYIRVPLQEGLLRDVVHPTEGGKVVFADALSDLLAQSRTSSNRPPPVAEPQKYGCLRAVDCMRDKEGETRSFDRGNFNVELVAIPEDQQIAFDLPENSNVVGFSMMMGPDTGYLTFKCNGWEHKSGAYDGFCYYERLGATQFDPHSTNWAVFYQHKGRPAISLHKGEPSDAPRKGFIGHFFIKNLSYRKVP